MNHRDFTYIKIACNLAVFIVSMLLIVFGVPKLLMFFMPFVVAWIIAWIATPIVRFVERHLKLKRKMSMVFVVIAIIAYIFRLMAPSSGEMTMKLSLSKLRSGIWDRRVFRTW